MGEGESGKGAALKKGKARRDAEKTARRDAVQNKAAERLNDAGPIARPEVATTEKGVKTAYKRGGPRPWETARAAREAKQADAIASGGVSPADADASSPFARAGLPEHMVAAMQKAGHIRTTSWDAPEVEPWRHLMQDPGPAPEPPPTQDAIRRQDTPAAKYEAA